MKKTLAILSAMLLAGCAGYSWRSSVPVEFRTVQVPGFRNGSDLTETGAVVTRQILREFQREGTFKILSAGAALEVQGEVISASPSEQASNYKWGQRVHGGMLVVKAKISVIDKVNGRVLVNNRKYSGRAHYSSLKDNTTAFRDTSRRAADDLAQKVVDDILKLKYRLDTEATEDPAEESVEGSEVSTEEPREQTEGSDGADLKSENQEVTEEKGNE